MGNEVWAHNVHNIASKLIEGGKLGTCMASWCILYGKNVKRGGIKVKGWIHAVHNIAKNLRGDGSSAKA